MIVCKFGGSSVASAKQIEKVKKIIESNEKRKVIIVSAPGKRDSSDIKVTDLLYACCKDVKEKGSCDETFLKIEQRFVEILKDLNLDDSDFKLVLEEVKNQINSNAGENYAASRGEYLNARLIALYLGYEFVDSANLIVIDENGEINEETWKLIENSLDKSKKYIIPGFYGRNINNDITTFSRGGSDISGSILSRAMRAEVYENWTDVAGCYNADPRFIKKAYPIDVMTYREVRELSAMGAGVFHVDAIAPVMDAGIPINIKNTNDVEALGTMIVASKDINGPIGVSHRGNFVKLFGRKLMLSKDSPVANKINEILKGYGILPSFSTQDGDSLSLLFEESNMTKDDLVKLQNKFINELKFEEILLKDSLSIVGAVGQNINEDTLYFKKSFDSLLENNIKVYQSIIGANSLSYFFVVDNSNASKAVEVVFDSLF